MLAFARFALLSAILGLSFAAGAAQPTEQTSEGKAARAAPADVFAALSRGYRAGAIVERVDIAWRSPSGAETADALWVGVDAQNGQAALALGELRVWGLQSAGSARIRAIHVRDPVRIFSLETRRADLPEALWGALPATPAPQLALLFAADPVAVNLWPSLRGVQWRVGQRDADSDAAVTLLGAVNGRRVELRAVPAGEEALALKSIVVSRSDGSRLALDFTRLEPMTTGAGAPITSDPASWRLDIGPRRVVASLSQLAPLPPMQPPVLFTPDGRPARLPNTRGNGEGATAIVLLDGDDPQAQRVAQLGLRIAADLLASQPDAPMLGAAIAVATNAEAEQLMQRLAQWRDLLGEEPLWTPGGAGRLSQYAGGADVDALVLLASNDRTTPILALRTTDALAAPAQAPTLRAAIRRIVRDALERSRADSKRHVR